MRFFRAGVILPLDRVSRAGRNATGDIFRPRAGPPLATTEAPLEYRESFREQDSLLPGSDQVNENERRSML